MGFRGHPPISYKIALNYFIAFMTDTKYETVAIMYSAEEPIKYCSATLKLKVFLTQGVHTTFVSLVLGFRKHFCLPKGFRKEKKVEKHCFITIPLSTTDSGHSKPRIIKASFLYKILYNLRVLKSIQSAKKNSESNNFLLTWKKISCKFPLKIYASMKYFS